MSVLCLIVLYTTAQAMITSRPDVLEQILQSPQKPQKPQDSVRPKVSPYSPVKVVEIINSNRYLQRKDFIPQVLKDSVILFHDGAYLYCDSAYYNEGQNVFEAFGNVRMEQGDTLFLYGKYMHYDGNIKLVKVRREVVLEHVPQKVTLFTDSLDYDRMMNYGYYFDGGMLVDSLNELTSFWGQYEPNIHIATFRDSVILTNPQFVLYSDRLKYDTDIKTAFISTPTTIVSDSGFIYTSNGWYNTETDKSLLLDQSTIVNKPGNRILKGDSIYYYKAQGYGEVFGNMFLHDTVNKVILRGHYGFYDELKDYAFATDSAFAIEYSQPDTLFAHADTLKLITILDSTDYKMAKALRQERDSLSALADSIDSDSIGLVLNPLPLDSVGIAGISVSDTIPAIDTIPVVPDSLSMSISIVDSLASEVDSLVSKAPPPQAMDTTIKTYRMLRAYYGVRFYRTDIQGVCDSLQFSGKDSILHMYKEPILWNTNRQLYGDTIDIYMNDSTIDRLHVKQSAFSIEEKDSIHFNQLKSRSLKVYFENQKVNRVLAEGSVETITYPEEKDGSLSLILNWLQGSYLEIFMKEGAFEKLVVWPKPLGKTTPFHLVKTEQLRLKDFFWYDYLRPLDKDDIFRETVKKAEDRRPPRASVFDRVDDMNF